MNKEYKTLLQHVQDTLKRRDFIRKLLVELKKLNTPVVVARQVTSECDTELYIIYFKSTPREYASTTLPIAAIHEGGKWYRAKPLPPEVLALLPEVPMQECQPNEILTIARFGITGIVMGEHEKSVRDTRPLWLAQV